MVALPEIQSETSAAIERAWAEAQVPHDDATLRASKIGDPCDRRLWFGFRWAHAPERHSGRALRIFETGNIEEDRLVEDLRRIGCHVDATDPETGEQYEVSFLAGHFTGHTDGEVEGVPEAPKTRHLLECKTHNDKSFKELKRLKVREAKPMHFAQMQIYMHGRALTRALYVAVNKNDDEIYTERVEYDPAFALAVLARAERLIRSDKAPARIVESLADKMAWQCTFCPAKAVCHDGALPRRTCRTCIHATPEMDGSGRWSCVRHLIQSLSPDQQRQGCPNHLYLPDLVPGEQVDADPVAETITYRFADGGTWVDGGRAAA
jgi:hypothetical protein